MLLIYQGSTPLPGTPEWDALSPEQQGAVYAGYQAVNATPGMTPGEQMHGPETATTVRVSDGRDADDRRPLRRDQGGARRLLLPRGRRPAGRDRAGRARSRRPRWAARSRCAPSSSARARAGRPARRRGGAPRARAGHRDVAGAQRRPRAGLDKPTSISRYFPIIIRISRKGRRQMRTTQITPDLIQLTRLQLRQRLPRARGRRLHADRHDARRQGAAGDLIGAARRAGGEIRRIALTHGHGDHAGGLDAIMGAPRRAASRCSWASPTRASGPARRRSTAGR